MKKVILRFITDEKFVAKDIGSLRGYIGNIFINEVMFHNHIDKYNFLYQSSKIQYKLIDGNLAILALGDEAAQLLKDKVILIDSLNINGNIIKINEKKYEEEEIALAVTDDIFKYKFDSLWIALNQENYKKYQNGELTLERALKNNLVELFKMCGVWADKEIKVKGEFKPNAFQKKDVKMIGFSGWFVTNINIPNYVGIGKSKSLGFGTVVRDE